ncbi:MAG: hypothetical protein KDB23_32740, partial [Planctomycetales bacterium]|nr:hypothetical protein [Planctomycetales bacterium]
MTCNCSLKLALLIFGALLIGRIPVASRCVAAEPLPLITVDSRGWLVYRDTGNGNRVPDFSFCGYRLGEQDIPEVATRVHLAPSGNDDTQSMQRAIDYVAALPVDSQGMRGAVCLGPGDFQVSGQLRIQASGVVLRGCGAGVGGTRVHATG